MPRPVPGPGETVINTGRAYQSSSHKSTCSLIRDSGHLTVPCTQQVLNEYSLECFFICLSFTRSDLLEILKVQGQKLS